MAGTALSQIRNSMPPAPRPKPVRDYADIPGMYGYDAQGRELGPTPTGPGGRIGGNDAQPQPGAHHVPVGWDSKGIPNRFDDSVDQSVIDNLPQGTGAPGQNAYVGAPDNSPMMQRLAQLLAAPQTSFSTPAVDERGRKVPTIQELAQMQRMIGAQFNSLRPQNDPRFQAQTAAMARHDAEMTPYQDKVLHDVMTLTPSNDVREYAAPAINKLAQLRDFIAQAIGGPTPDDPLRGRAYVRNKQGLPPDTGNPGAIGRNF